MSAAIRKLIKVDGTEVDLPGAMTMRQIQKKIGADGLDTVMLRDRKHVMVVDDNGLDKGLPVNKRATELYHEVCRPGTTHQIVGDVAVVPDADFA